jgi:HEAT repeat protein
LDTLLAEYYYSAHLFLESWENFQNKRYVGTIKHEKSMTLHLSKKSHELSGYLIYPDGSERRQVHGKVDRQGNAVFAEYKDVSEKLERAYKGKFTETFDKFTGSWFRNAEDQGNPVTFKTSEAIREERHRSAQQDHEYQVKLLIDHLVSDLSSDYGDKAERAVFLLSKMTSKWVTAELLRVMKEKTSKDPVHCSHEIRQFLEALKGKKDNRITVSVIPFLACEDAEIKALAAEVLGNQRAISAIMPLITLLQHQYSFVREKASRALAKIGEPAVKPLLTALNERTALNGESILALGELKDSRAIPLLMKCLRNSNNDIRTDAARAFGKIGKPAIKPLLAAFKDEDNEVYYAVVEAFAKMGAIALPPLLATLKSEDPRQRSGAIRALGELGDSRAVGPLIDEFEDTVEAVRIDAADALSRIGRPAVPLLVQLLHSKELSLRKLAIRGLSRIKDPGLVEPLIDAP